MPDQIQIKFILKELFGPLLAKTKGVLSVKAIRALLFLTGVAAVITALLIYFIPHFESGAYEDYPWIMAYDIWVPAYILLKSLFICSLLAIMLELFLKKKPGKTHYFFVFTLILMWSLFMGRLPESFSFEYVQNPLNTQLFLNDERDQRDLYGAEFSELTQVAPKRNIYQYSDNVCTNNDATKSWWFGNLVFSRSYSVDESEIPDELFGKYCENI